jgi:hypothetical protein
MNYELPAKFASLEEDEESLVFAFSADEFGDGKYVMFQYPLRPEKQDSRLGQDGLYIECDDQLKGCYLGVESIRRVENHIEIDLTEEGKQRLKVQRVFITPVPWPPMISDGLARLAELSGGEYNVEYQ